MLKKVKQILESANKESRITVSLRLDKQVYNELTSEAKKLSKSGQKISVTKLIEAMIKASLNEED